MRGGATHLTLEITEDVPFLKRVGRFAERHKVYAAYHSHTQGGMAAFDAAFAASKANMANVDFGHYVAGGNKGAPRSSSSRNSTTGSRAST